MSAPTDKSVNTQEKNIVTAGQAVLETTSKEAGVTDQGLKKVAELVSSPLVLGLGLGTSLFFLYKEMQSNKALRKENMDLKDQINDIKSEIDDMKEEFQANKDSDDEEELYDESTKFSREMRRKRRMNEREKENKTPRKYFM